MKHTRKGSETRSSSKAMLTCGGGCVQGALLDFTKGGSSATAGATGRGQRFHISVNTHTRDCLIFSWRASTFPADSWQIAGVFQTGGHHGSSVSLTAGEADELAAMTGSSLQVRRHCPPTVFPPPCLPEESAFPGPFAAVSPPFPRGALQRLAELLATAADANGYALGGFVAENQVSVEEAPRSQVRSSLPLTAVPAAGLQQKPRSKAAKDSERAVKGGKKQWKGSERRRKTVEVQ